MKQTRSPEKAARLSCTPPPFIFLCWGMWGQTPHFAIGSPPSPDLNYSSFWLIGLREHGPVVLRVPSALRVHAAEERKQRPTARGRATRREVRVELVCLPLRAFVWNPDRAEARKDQRAVRQRSKENWLKHPRATETPNRGPSCPRRQNPELLTTVLAKEQEEQHSSRVEPGLSPQNTTHRPWHVVLTVHRPLAAATLNNVGATPYLAVEVTPRGNLSTSGLEGHGPVCHKPPPRN